MKKATLTLVTALLVGTGPAESKDFPLQFKTLNAQEAMMFPGYGAYGQLQLAKPSSVSKEPRATSSRPLYGELRAVSSDRAVAFRLDESGGTGQGYDTLIVDSNNNGDLTDDAAIKRAAPTTGRVSSPSYDQGSFTVPSLSQVGGNKLVYYAEMFVYRTALANDRTLSSTSTYLGYLRLKAGWYMETTVSLNGVQQRVGLVDGDANGQLGDTWKPRMTKTISGESWYFSMADCFLQEKDGSGSFSRSILNDSSMPFNQVLYLGTQPYRAALTADSKTLLVELWNSPLTEVQMQPQGDQVRSVTLARESTPGQWELMQANAANGRLQLPPGNYRVYQTTLTGKAADGEIMVSAYLRSVKPALAVEAGKPAVLNCGGPLEVKVTAAKTIGIPTSTDGERTVQKAEPILRIGASVEGNAGEVYSSFYKMKDKTVDRPPKPTFAVMDGGKVIASGNLEYG
ncbi:MAG: hypothetical protein WCO56_05465 [Verrucomicrobiota bacterium]